MRFPASAPAGSSVSRICRITGDRDEAMCQLRPLHEAAIADFAGAAATGGAPSKCMEIAVAVVPGCPQIIAADGLPVVPGVDGLITGQPGVVLAIYVADCGAIWLADRKTGAIGLLHSGKKGTESNIFGERLAGWRNTSAPGRKMSPPCSAPASARRTTMWISPRRSPARRGSSGVGNFIDCGLNTASDPSRFYSYRKELGKTGRMMALIVRDFLP